MRDLSSRRGDPPKRPIGGGPLANLPASLTQAEPHAIAPPSVPWRRTATPRTNDPAPFEYPSIDGLARLMAALVADGDRDPTTFVNRCGWCRRFEVEGRWLDLDDAARSLMFDLDGRAPTITHGICDECVSAFERALDGD